MVGLSQVIKIIATILTTVLLSRILKPEDFGLIAMVAPVLALALLLQEFGLSAAAIQKTTLSITESSSLFWLNLLTALSVAAFIIITSPFIAWFFEDSRATLVAIASAGTLLLASTYAQHLVVLQRELKFGLISIAEISGVTVNLIASVSTALLLKNYWSILIGTAAGTITQAMILWTFARWKPSFKFDLKPAYMMLKFAGEATATNVLNFLIRNLDNVLIAKVAGPVELGLYDRSYRVMMLPLQGINAPVNRLMLPLLSRSQSEPERFRVLFNNALWFVALLTLPLLVVVCFNSERFIVFLLGESWRAAAPIFFWLMMTGIIQTAANLTGNLYLSTGQTERLLTWSWISSLVTAVATLVGVFWGAVGVAIGLFASSLIRLPFLYSWATKGTSVKTHDLYLAQCLPVISSIVVCLFFSKISVQSNLAYFALSLAAAYISTIALALVVPQPRRLMGMLVGYLQRLLIKV